MVKKSVRNSRKLFIPLFSLFLLLVAISLLVYQIKVPKEAIAVPGSIKFGVGNAGAGCAAGELVVGGGVAANSGCASFEDSFATKAPKFAGLSVSGNVGIGTTAPDEKLGIYGSSFTSILKIKSDQRGDYLTTGGTLGQIYFGTDGSGAGTPVVGKIKSYVSSGVYQLRFSTHSNEDVLNIYGGNVGIGTTAPGYKLDVAGTGNFTGTVTASSIYADNDYNRSNTAYGRIGNNGYFDTVNGRGADSLELNYYDGGEVHIGAGGTKAIRAAIMYDGNNGGYYVNPDSTSNMYAWTTSGRNYNNEWIQMNNYTGLYSPLNGAHFYPNNASYGSWKIDGTRNGWGGIEFPSGSGNISLMIGQGGWGGMTTGMHANSYGWLWRFEHSRLYADYANFAGTVTAASDVRNKTNINTLPENTLEKVLGLRGVTYNWNTEYLNKHIDIPNTVQIGVVAQEVEKIFPELVETDKDGYKSVDYTRLSPILIEAVKEQQKEIDSLKSEVDNLKKEIKEIRLFLKK